MGLVIGGVSPRDLVLDGQSVALYVGGSPPVKVWPTTEVVQITLGTGTQARDQLRAALSARGLNYQTVEELPFDIELVGTGSAQQMFYGCSSLTSIPAMDTSGVTNMTYMFRGCSSLTSIPSMDTSGVTNMTGMFHGCSALTHVPDMDTSGVTNMTSLFSGCSSLTQAPVMDTSSVMYMNDMFYNCASLTQVPDLDVGQAEGVNYMFERCSSLMDGMVRLIRPDGTLPPYRSGMITNSGLTREPFFLPDGTPI